MKHVLALAGVLVVIRMSGQFDGEQGMAPVERIGAIGDVLPGDLNGDGLTDLVVAGGWPCVVAKYIATEDGHFAPPETLVDYTGDFPTPQVSRKGALLMDIDVDGDKDIVYQRSNGPTFLLENTGSGDLAEATILFTDLHSALDGMRAGDLDGDGDEDLVMLRDWYPDNRIAAYVNNGGGEMAFAGYIGDLTDAGDRFDLGDTDGDSDIDVIASRGDNDNQGLLWFENNGTGSFGPAMVLVDGSNGEIEDLEMGDVDGDLIADVLFRAGPGTVGLHLSSGPDGASTILYSSPDGVLGGGIGLGDMNADGTLDVVIAESVSTGNSGNHLVSCLANAGDGSFDTAPATLITPVFSGPFVSSWGFRAVDIDNDGLTDLLDATPMFEDGSVTGSLYYYKGVPSGTMSAPSLVNRRVDLNGLLLGDVDGDGDLDAVTCTDAGRNLPLLLRGSGTGSFERPDTVTSQDVLIGNTIVRAGYSGMELRDIDGDGSDDILFNSWYHAADTGGSGLNTVIGWMRNSGEGRFADPVFLSGDGSEPRMADLDGDGEEDIVFIEGYNVAWRRSLGGGEFDATIFLSGASTHSIACADFDGDGDEDILSAHPSALATILTNGGNGLFTEALLFGVSTEQHELMAVDLDNDGWPDVVRGEADMSPIRWYRNLGAGEMALPVTLLQLTTSGPQLNFWTFCDVDQDDDADLIFTMADQSGIYWVQNLGNGQFAEWSALAVVHGEPHDLAWGDIDGDGSMDLAYTFHPDSVLGEFSYNPGWLRSNGMPMGLDTGGHWHQAAITPDPYCGSATFVLAAPLAGSDLMLLLDGSGRTLREQPGQGSERIIVSTSGLSTGTYMVLIVESGVSRLIGRLLVE